MIEGHGDDLYRYNSQVRINFSSNICQQTDHTALKAHLANHLDLVNHYPEPQPRKLEEQLAEYHDIPAECVMVTSGVTEAIYLIAQMTRGGMSVIPQPTFSEYADACRLNEHIITYEYENDQKLLPTRRIYWLCNPNNPTGSVMTEGIIDHLVATNPIHLFVVDQSYEGYTAARLVDVKQVMRYPNLILLHSLSKRYAVPGMRVGYVTAHPEILRHLRQYQRPWSVGALAIEGARFLIAQDKPAISDLEGLLKETARLRDALRALPGISVCDTDSTFMLCMIEQASSLQLKNWLIDHEGILIRNCSNFANLSPHHFRIATQSAEENNALISALHRFLNE